MEMLRGYELLGEWKNSNCGKTVKGTKEGKTFFIKKYQTPVKPENNGALDEKTFQRNEQQFNQFISRRTRLNSTLRAVAGEGGNIVIPAEEFIEGNNYMEASEFVEGVVPDEELEEVLASLAPDVKKLLMLTAAGALGTVHSKQIIHSDLKLENVLLARNPRSGNYVAKIIDFDSGYFTDDIPDELTGDIRYFSPELAAYGEEEDDRASLKGTLTTKSDIFSLGIIFHRYLTGEFPQGKNLTEALQRRKEKGRPIYCWNILLNGCELVISDAITEPHYRILIEDMLDIDPKKRPTATEVLRRLKSPVTVVIEEPWPDHNLMLKKDKILADGNLGLKKRDSSSGHVYELMDNRGRKQTLTKDELVGKGYAVEIASAASGASSATGFGEPWPEHSFTWNEAKLTARGFVAADRKAQAGINGYNLYRSDSTSTFFTVEKLKMIGYITMGGAASGAASGGAPARAATPTPPPVEAATTFCEPWPEHNVAMDIDLIKSKGYTGSRQELRGTIKGYLFFKGSENRFLNIDTLCMLKLAKRL